MRILVTGGRDFNDALAVATAMKRIAITRDLVRDELVVIEGGATGADSQVRAWCKRLGVHCATMYANWDYYNKGAGHRRNGGMLLLKPDLLVAFPGGKGTTNMKEQADKAGVEIVEVAA